MHNIGWPPYVIHTLIGRTAKRQINQWKTLHRCASWSSSICCYRNGYFKINCPHPYKGWMCGISIVGCLCSIGNSAASHKQPLQHHMTMRSNRTWPSEICFKCVLIHKIRNLYINWKKKNDCSWAKSACTASDGPKTSCLSRPIHFITTVDITKSVIDLIKYALSNVGGI